MSVMALATLAPAPRGLFRLMAAVVAAFALLSPRQAGAQGTLVDEGTFQISVGGTPAGSERFSIRSSETPQGSQLIATAEITLREDGAELQLRPALQLTGGDMAVTAYQVKISGGRNEEVFVTATDGRFLTRSLSDRGERERELRAVAGTVLVDLGVAHHYHFLVNPVGGRRDAVTLIVPREGRQHELSLSEVGNEPVDVGGRSVSALHLRLGAGPDTRDVWVDDAGRVLRVDHPAVGYSAVRVELP
jgi:hypothetical protein